MRHGCEGFTLLELMMVLVLIAVLLGMVGLTIGSNPARLAGQDAEALARLVQQMRERAVLNGRVYGVRLSVDGFRAVYLAEEERWQPVTELFPWPTQLKLRLESDGQFVSLGTDEGPAQLLALSSDEISEFTLSFFIQGRALLRLSSDGIGPVVIDD